MKLTPIHTKAWFAGLAIFLSTLTACKKDGNPNNLPDVSPEDYAGTVDGFTSTADVYPNSLVAYWSFDNDKSESISKATPAASAGDAIVDGFKGKALELNNGYLHFTNQFNAFKTANLKSFTISQWVQISNNGSKKTMLFQLARPGMANGNIDLILETNLKPASDVANLSIHPYFTTVSNGRQDNVNANFNKSPQIGPGKWAHIVLTYNGATGVFNIFANGQNIGNYSNRGVGNNLFNSFEPNEVIIGGTYNVIPGKTVSTDTSFGAMTGKIDELRIYNTAIPDAVVKSLYNLGLAGK